MKNVSASTQRSNVTERWKRICRNFRHATIILCNFFGVKQAGERFLKISSIQRAFFKISLNFRIEIGIHFNIFLNKDARCTRRKKEGSIEHWRARF